MSAAVDWVRRLGLEPHPEGGYFRRIYTAGRNVDTATGARPLATSIYYLLDQLQPRGRLHRNRSDILHFLIDGGPVEYLLLDSAGSLRRERLGQHDARHLLVAGGCWKASQLLAPATHALVAEAVVPGFDYADHEYAREQDLRREHAAHLAALAPFLTAAG